MLRITEQQSAEAANGWYAPAAYYQHGQGMVGCWGGKGAVRLGLKGIVRKGPFGWLSKNVNPKTRQRVTVRRRAKRTVGYTFRFSVCKSVSLLYGVSGDDAILDAFRAAVDESMREMEAEMKTRVRKARQNTDRTTGNMIWAEFIHKTSCPVDGRCDPQLTAYVFVFNMTWDEEEECWKAGKFQDLKSDASYFQAGFRVRMANKLQDLGFPVEQTRDDFEIAGIPQELLKRFSRRTERIERLARERCITNPKWKAELGPKTREKGPVRSVATLQKQWDKRLSSEERELLASVHRREKAFRRQSNGEATAVDEAIQRCFARHDVVRERKLITEALKCGVGSVAVEPVRREVASRPLSRHLLNGLTMVSLGHD